VVLLGPSWAATDTDTLEGPALPIISTGKSGKSLKWLPYRPVPESRTPTHLHEPGLPPAATASPAASWQRTEESTVERAVGATSSASASPLNDPFGDRLPRELPLTSAAGMPVNAQPRAAAPFRPVAETARRLPEPKKPSFVANLPLSDEEGRWDGPVPGGVAKFHCPSPDNPADKRFFRKISELNPNVEASAGEFPPECRLEGPPYQPRNWSCTTFCWKASGLCHKPLYFEDVQLERYGHSWGPIVQPVFSAAHFFLSVPILPYKMGLNPPNECIYTLGYYRPGSCAPYLIDPIPISVRAGLLQAAAVTGAVYAIP
jgi:hypothetical protein